MPITVLIADDHVFYRESVRALLSNVPEIEVIGEANNGEAAIDQPTDAIPMFLQQGYRFIRKYAIRSSTIGDDFLIVG